MLDALICLGARFKPGSGGGRRTKGAPVWNQGRWRVWSERTVWAMGGILTGGKVGSHPSRMVQFKRASGTTWCRSRWPDRGFTWFTYMEASVYFEGLSQLTTSVTSPIRTRSRCVRSAPVNHGAQIARRHRWFDAFLDGTYRAVASRLL